MKYTEIIQNTNKCTDIFDEPCGFDNGNDCDNCQRIYDDESESVMIEFQEENPDRDIFDIYEVEFLYDNFFHQRTWKIEHKPAE